MLLHVHCLLSASHFQEELVLVWEYFLSLPSDFWKDFFFITSCLNEVTTCDTERRWSVIVALGVESVPQPQNRQDSTWPCAASRPLNLLPQPLWC